MFGPDDKLRRRQGFQLTDNRYTSRENLSEIHYCVLCHERDKDTCSKGIRDKEGKVTANPLGIPLPGCPLGEKISEMHTLRKRGDAIGALAIVTVDNPLCPGTGHRICNDCMKACIYQKQEPVNIPQVETGVLTDVLNMPWGVEIYGLLTRWNPLNIQRPYALEYNGKNVLVVGLGPAGYTLSHYLLNEGFGVVAIDGLKIEPLPEDIVGTAEGRAHGGGAVKAVAPRPIRAWSEIYRPLDERVLEGFGGVSEYGITVRWDKNFLTLIHLTLARRDKLTIYGGVRFGGALPLDEAWGMGIDHVAIAAGAGRPTIIDIKNNLIRGIRKASDFLMALQLTGAFKKDALSNLQARLPAVVIGGGLTGVDTATELMAYYPIQVEKTLDRYDALVRDLGEARVRGMMDAEELGILDEFRGHGQAVKAERARAEAAGQTPNFIEMIRGWGGVTLAYRKRLQDAPAYRLNHEEVALALQEGISVTENMNPVEAIPDEFGHVQAMVFTRADGSRIELPARTVLVAAGTVPNVTYEKEHPGSFSLDSKQKFFQGFKAVKSVGANFSSPDTFKLEPDPNGFFTSHDTDGKFVTYYGDNHPRYNGNVVKAMASAKHGYPHVVALFADHIAALDPGKQPQREQAWQSLVAGLDDQLLARVEKVVRLTPTIVEVIVRAPAAARHFHPGQFYRLQNFERLSPHVRVDDHVASMLMEGIALTGAWVDAEKGLLSLITLEMGVSSRLCAYLKPGEPVVVMGPTGTPTEIPEKSSGAARGRWSRQRRVVLDRQGAQGARQSRALFRGLQERRRSLQARRHRDRHRPGDLGQRHGRRDRAASPAGSSLPRQHRRGDGRLCGRQAWRAEGGPEGRVAHHRDRLRSHDERRAPGAPRRAAAVPRSEARRHRQHQLADAVHDEGSLRAVPAAPRRSRDRQGGVHLLLLQPGLRSSTGSTSTTFKPGCVRTASRRSSRISGSSICSTRLNPSWFTYKLLACCRQAQRSTIVTRSLMLSALAAWAPSIAPAASASATKSPSR